MKLNLDNNYHLVGAGPEAGVPQAAPGQCPLRTVVPIISRVGKFHHGLPNWAKVSREAQVFPGRQDTSSPGKEDVTLRSPHSGVEVGGCWMTGCQSPRRPALGQAGSQWVCWALHPGQALGRQRNPAPGLPTLRTRLACRPRASRLGGWGQWSCLLSKTMQFLGISRTGWLSSGNPELSECSRKSQRESCTHGNCPALRDSAQTRQPGPHPTQPASSASDPSQGPVLLAFCAHSHSSGARSSAEESPCAVRPGTEGFGDPACAAKAPLSSWRQGSLTHRQGRQWQLALHGAEVCQRDGAEGGNMAQSPEPTCILTPLCSWGRSICRGNAHATWRGSGIFSSRF